jgi:3-hydroxybutyryl-CoA dehydratase
MAVLLERLSRGDRIKTADLDLSPQWIREYVEAVEDSAASSLGDFTPPMAVATLSVRALLEQAKLPEGAVHAGQDLVFNPAVRIGTPLRGSAIIKSRGERSGWVLMNISHEVLDDDYEQVMTGNALLAFPVSGSGQPSNPETAPVRENPRPPSAVAELEPVVKALSQDKINRYAEVSGDRNPLHIDPAFAAGTQFGGTIAHGMLVLAYLSEMMTRSFGDAWLTGGRLKVRFRGAARPGDTVTASGRVVKATNGQTECEVECRNQNGEVLISGESSVRVS